MKRLFLAIMSLSISSLSMAVTWQGDTYGGLDGKKPMNESHMTTLVCPSETLRVYIVRAYRAVVDTLVGYVIGTTTNADSLGHQAPAYYLNSSAGWNRASRKVFVTDGSGTDSTGAIVFTDSSGWSDKLDGLEASQFLRSDAIDTTTKNLWMIGDTLFIQGAGGKIFALWEDGVGGSNAHLKAFWLNHHGAWIIMNADTSTHNLVGFIFNTSTTNMIDSFMYDTTGKSFRLTGNLTVDDTTKTKFVLKSDGNGAVVDTANYAYNSGQLGGFPPDSFLMAHGDSGIDTTKDSLYFFYGRNYGIYSKADSNYGVYGLAHNFGVYGLATDTIGVYGQAVTFGVKGYASNQSGVIGYSPVAGVSGQASNVYGVYGTAVNGYGVYGYTGGNYGVYGQSADTFGVFGWAEKAIGVYGTAPYYGGYFTAYNYALACSSDTDIDTTLWVKKGDAIVDGDILSSGDLGIGADAIDSVAGFYALFDSTGNATKHYAILAERYEGSGTHFIGRRALGSHTYPRACSTGTGLVVFGGAGYDGTSWTKAKARMECNSSQLWTSTAYGTYLTFWTTADDSTNERERLRIYSNGNATFQKNITADTGKVTDIVLSASNDNANNLVVNGSFESGSYTSGSYVIGNGWIFDYGSGTHRIHLATDGVERNNCQWISDSATIGNNRYIYQIIKVKNATKYTFSGYFWTDTSKAYIKLGVTKGGTDYLNYNCTPLRTWTQKSYTFTTTDTILYITGYLNVNNSGGTLIDTLMIDAWSIREGDCVLPYDDHCIRDRYGEWTPLFEAGTTSAWEANVGRKATYVGSINKSTIAGGNWVGDSTSASLTTVPLSVFTKGDSIIWLIAITDSAIARGKKINWWTHE